MRFAPRACARGYRLLPAARAVPIRKVLRGSLYSRKVLRASLLLKKNSSSDAAGGSLDFFPPIRSGLRGSFDFRDVDLHHVQHGLHGFGMADQFDEARGRDLPIEPELVDEPAALDFLAARRQFLPVVVDLLLRIAADHERHGLGEWIAGAAVESGEALPIELKRDGENAALRPGSVAGVAQLVQPARVLEDGEVEFDCFFSVGVEPQKRCDAGKILECAHGFQAIRSDREAASMRHKKIANRKGEPIGCWSEVAGRNCTPVAPRKPRDHPKEKAAMKLNTYLNYGGNCGEAFRFYEKELGGKINMLMTHGQSPVPGGLGPEMKDAVLHASITIGETAIMASDVPPDRFKPMRSAYLCLAAD